MMGRQRSHSLHLPRKRALQQQPVVPNQGDEQRLRHLRPGLSHAAPVRLTRPGEEAGPLHTSLSALVQRRFSLCLLHRAAVMRHLARAKSIISIITLVVTAEKAVPKIILVTLTG